MSVRTIVLGSLAALVAAGGLYLLVEVRSSGASAPPDDKLAADDRAAREAAARARPPRVEDLGAGPTAAPPRGAARPTPEALTPRRGRDPRHELPVADPVADKPDPVANPDFDAAMLEANKLYDRHNYDEARTLALKLLERQPGTVRMLRVVVASSCILGDAETSQKYWLELPEFDRGQMTTRCARFGVTFAP